MRELREVMTPRQARRWFRRHALCSFGCYGPCWHVKWPNGIRIYATSLDALRRKFFREVV